MSAPSSSRASSIHSFSMYDERRYQTVYSLDQLNSLKKLHGLVNACEGRLKTNKEKLASLSTSIERYNLLAQIQTMTFRNEMRSQELDQLRSMCFKKQKSCKELSADIEAKNESYNLIRKRNVVLEERATDFQKEYDTREKRLSVFTKLIRARRKMMLEELHSIFNIELEMPATSGKGACACTALDFISGVHLPSTFTLNGHVDVQYSTALGLVAHLLHCISTILDYNWRYPIKNYGSTSKIANAKDNAVLSLHGSYRWKTERIRLDNAITLLGKNIAQLRSDCGLLSPQLERILFTLDDWFAYVVKGTEDRKVSFQRPWDDINSPASVIEMETPVDDFGLKVLMPSRYEVEVEEATEENCRSSNEHSLISNFSNDVDSSFKSCMSTFTSDISDSSANGNTDDPPQ